MNQSSLMRLSHKKNDILTISLQSGVVKTFQVTVTQYNIVECLMFANISVGDLGSSDVRGV